MSFCPKCGTGVQEGGKFCPACGAAVGPAAPKSPSSSADAYIGRKLDNKFLIEELLGVGGMGKVYKATQLSLDKTVCVKVLRSIMMADETLVGRFHREARAASRLNHPNSITVIDFGQDKQGGSLYLAMEFVPGKDLGKVIHNERPLSEERIVKIMDQVLSALADAHAAGIVHRDLKPENIMVTDLRGTKDFVKVLDFGIAKIQEGPANEPGLTQVGMVCGTPEYMSPEQARGEVLDARSDVYAAGVILYQMVVGKIPFSAPTAMGIVTKHLTEPPVPPSQVEGITVSPALEKVILKAMSKDRNGRQPTALALQQELNAVLTQKTAFAQQAPLGNSLFDDTGPETKLREPPVEINKQVLGSPSAPSGSHAWLWIVLVLVLIAGAAMAGYFLWWLPKQENQGGVDAGGVAYSVDAGAMVEEPAGVIIDAGARPNPELDAGAVQTAADRGPPPPAVQEVPESAMRYYKAGKELMVRSKLKKAIMAFDKAIKKYPGYAAAYKALGTCHMQLGNIRLAKKNYGLYLIKAPGAPDAADIKDLIKSF
ncbi:MAG TPA: protein kinase [Myxococcota bacterium]|nr:protein kinase [Myxococcota bacterium]